MSSSVPTGVPKPHSNGIDPHSRLQCCSFQCYNVSNTFQVVWQTLQQGLVTPGSAIPTLIAMCTDPLPNVRVRIEQLIKDIDTK